MSPSDHGPSRQIAENLEAISRRIAAAARAVARPPEAVRLVAVTKGVAVDAIREAVQAGHRIFGENRVQEAAPKIEALTSGTGEPGDPSEAEPQQTWHLIGHLQTNKVRRAVGLFDLIHSVDSERLARAIEAEAARQGRHQAVLLQVNVAGESQKSGVPSADLPALALAAAGLHHLEVRGLMTIPPLGEAAEASRPYFRRLRELAREVTRQIPALTMEELSMGMSADFEVAIEEGATLVRVGAAIFGDRT